MGKPPINPKDPHWFPMKAAVDLRAQQTGDLETAIRDLQQDAENDELGIMRRNRVSNKCEHVAAPLWKPHVIEVYLRLDGVPIKMNNQHTVAAIYHRTDDWLYYIWKPHFDRLYLGSTEVDHDDDSDAKQPLRPIDCVKAVLPDLSLSPKLTLKAATKAIADECARRGWKLPILPDTVARALGRRRQ